MKAVKGAVPLIIVSLCLAQAWFFTGKSEATEVLFKMAELKTASKLAITSPAFRDNDYIPAKYTCEGKDVIPPLDIERVPEGAKSLALIVDDPDAPHGVFVHWVVWDIDPGTSEIKEGSAPRGAVQGMNDFRKPGYGGPCPPSGTHRYFFKLYALDTKLTLGKGAGKADLEKAMRGHIIGEARLVGLYEKGATR